MAYNRTLQHFVSQQDLATVWASGQSYITDQLVILSTPKNELYRCLIAHTSGGSFATDLAAGYWVQVSSAASGTKNYLTNPDFDTGQTTGWTMQKVTLSALAPTGNIGAPDANHSIAVSSSSPLEGSNSLLVQGTSLFTAGNCLVSKEFSIDREDKAKVMTFSFYYEAITSNMDFSGTSANTWAVYIAEVTTATPNTVVSWIQPAGVYNLTQGSGVGFASGTFQTTATGTAYRLVLVCINSEAAATTLKVDDFRLGPQTVVYGSPVTDWVSSTPTYSNAGTTSLSVHSTRRVGDTLQIQGRSVFATAGAGAVLRLRIPSSIGSIDTTKVQTGGLAGAVGSYAAQIGGSIFNGSVSLTTTANEVSFVPDGTSGAHLGNAFISGTELTYTLSVPISGWSSSVQMSNDTDTRVVAARFTKASIPSIASGAPATVVASVTSVSDTHGGLTTASGVYTVPVSGYYKVSGSVASVSTSWTAGSNRYISLRATGSQSIVLGTTLIWATATNYSQVGGSTTLYYSAGDTISFSIENQSGSAFVGSASAAENWFSIERLSGPATIAASESVQAKYWAGANGASNTSSPVNFSSKVYDSHGSVTTGAAWKFTAPISGKYLVACFLNNSTANSNTSVYVYRNGGLLEGFGYIHSTAAGLSQSVIVELNAGQYIDIRTSAGYSYYGNASRNDIVGPSTIEIVRVGN